MNRQLTETPYSSVDERKDIGWSGYYKAMKEAGNTIYGEGETLKWEKDKEAETARARAEMAKSETGMNSMFL